MKLTTVISSKVHLGFTLLEKSCAFNNLDLNAIECEEKFFNSNRVKDEYLKGYLEDLPSDTIVLFTDGYDTFFFAGETEILNKFIEFKTDLLFSAETGCYPDYSLSSYYPKTISPYRFLNSGGFIGKAGIIKEFISDGLLYGDEKFPYSNQYLWTLCYLQNQKSIKLDTLCSIFCTLSQEVIQDPSESTVANDHKVYADKLYDWFKETFILRNGRIYNRITNTWPSILHFNGNSKYITVEVLVALIFSHKPE